MPDGHCLGHFCIYNIFFSHNKKKHQSLYPPWKSPQYPLDMKLGGPHIQSAYCEEEKHVFPLPGIKPPLSSL
jgi:hypothetical protein